MSGADGESGEDRFVAAMRAIATDPAARGLTDDAAVLAEAGSHLVVTHDTMVEGVHWLSAQDAADVAWKLVAVNLSDLAAKGADPAGLVLSFMLGDPAWDARFAQGLAEAVRTFDAPLIGGDTVSAAAPGSPRVIGLTALGRAAVSPPARDGARAGQALWVTGTIGAALAGFEALRDGRDDAALTRRYRRPAPRLEEGLAIAPIAGAMMDVSDGLLLDARRMALASGVTIAIEGYAVPVAAALARRRLDAMTWGDDYELLFTLPAGTEPPVAATPIGSVLTAGDHPLLVDGAPPPAGLPLGYAHGS